MKRSYEGNEKINSKTFFSSEQLPCPQNTQSGIVPDISQNIDQLCEEDLRNQSRLAELSPFEDSFRSRITSKLKSVLDGFTSQGNQTSDDFLLSAKSQISTLLRQKKGVVSKEKSSLKPSLKSFTVDPLEIQISLKLQDLLCKALDDRLLCKNGAPIEEAEWRDLSHLLQDFLSSAKKKISFSLTADKLPVPAKSACNKGNLFSDKRNCQIKHKVQKKAPESIVQTMECSEETDSSCDSSTGMLLLGDAEKAPDYLDLSLEVEEDSDVDDPGLKNDDSDEEVVVLGEKKPTYQEITLDEEGEVSEKVVEMQKKVRIPKDLEDLLYDCPKCEKKFRVESLLKFHIRMHSVVESHGRVPVPAASVSDDTESVPRRSISRKEKENKLNSKSSHQHKIQKHARRKVKITS